MGHDGRCSTYGIDYALLRRLQAEACIFAYHCNAAELAALRLVASGLRFQLGYRIFENQGLVIKFFSPHGVWSAPTAGTITAIIIRSSVDDDCCGLITDSPHRVQDTPTEAGSEDPEARPGLDLRGFCIAACEAQSTPNRFFMLIHPQYYFAIDSVAAEEHFPTNPLAEGILGPLFEGCFRCVLGTGQSGSTGGRSLKPAPTHFSRQIHLHHGSSACFTRISSVNHGERHSHEYAHVESGGQEIDSGNR